MILPPVYPIADVGTLRARGLDLRVFAQELLEGGAEILQLRHKCGSPKEILAQAAVLSEVTDGTECLLVMNDRADLAVLAGWRAVHVGHTDLPPEAVRRIFQGNRTNEEEAGTASAGPGAVLVGVSTHNEEQVRSAEAGSANYVAIGPVFGTATKADAEPVVGLEGVRRARALTRKPLVAIGGITLENAAAVREAGADSVAVIGGLLSGSRSGGSGVAATLQDFLRRVR